jgi:hypothetical protein
LDPINGAWPPNRASFNPVLGPTLLLILKTAFESNANILVEFDPYAIMQANTSIPLNVALGTGKCIAGECEILLGSLSIVWVISQPAIVSAGLQFAVRSLWR